jgi:hypothetical protein
MIDQFIDLGDGFLYILIGSHSLILSYPLYYDSIRDFNRVSTKEPILTLDFWKDREKKII